VLPWPRVVILATLGTLHYTAVVQACLGTLHYTQSCLVMPQSGMQVMTADSLLCKQQGWMQENLTKAAVTAPHMQ